MTGLSTDNQPVTAQGIEPVTAPFPLPSALIIGALDDLRLAAERPPQDRDELRRLAELRRPWDPPTCPPELQHYLWRWLDDVVLWINDAHLARRPADPALLGPAPAYRP